MDLFEKKIVQRITELLVKKTSMFDCNVSLKYLENLKENPQKSFYVYEIYNKFNNTSSNNSAIDEYRKYIDQLVEKLVQKMMRKIEPFSHQEKLIIIYYKISLLPSEYN